MKKSLTLTDSYQLPDVIPEYIPYPDLSYPAPTYVTLDDPEDQFGPAAAQQMQVEEEDDLADGYPEVYTVHYVPEGETAAFVARASLFNVYAAIIQNQEWKKSIFFLFQLIVFHICR